MKLLLRIKMCLDCGTILCKLGYRPLLLHRCFCLSESETCSGKVSGEGGRGAQPTCHLYAADPPAKRLKLPLRRSNLDGMADKGVGGWWFVKRIQVLRRDPNGMRSSRNHRLGFWMVW
jgi:hypothetical protein